MKPFLFLYAVLFVLGIPLAPSAQNINDTITSQQLKSYIDILASDSMKGRQNYSQELWKCARYIAREFEQYGLKKPVALNSYIQAFSTLGNEKQRNESSFIDSSALLSNIIGILPGKTKPDEVIVFCAHYDHLGSDSTLGGDEVYNGANDNASGTAALLSLANYYALKRDNERTLVFCAFAGEELGLVGSERFVKSSNLKNVKAVVNIEMIGRTNIGKKSVFITGEDKSNLSSILKKNIPREMLRIRHEPSLNKHLFKRSDNFPFAVQGIVAHTIMSSDDDDECYHKPCDEIKRIDFDNMAYIVRAIALGCKTIISGLDTPE